MVLFEWLIDAVSREMSLSPANGGLVCVQVLRICFDMCTGFARLNLTTMMLRIPFLHS